MTTRQENRPGTMTAAGAVVVHYHREQELDRLLGELTRFRLYGDGCIVVVDNGSDGEAFARVERRHPGVTFLHLDNPGYGAAVNAGITHLANTCDVVTVLTHEVEVSEPCLEHLVGALRGDPDIGQIAPLLMDARSPDVLWSTGGQISHRRKRPSNRLRGRRIGDLDGADLRADVPWVDGAVFAVRVADHEAIGGLSEEYWLYLEDVDFGWRMRTALGRRVVCDVSVRATQEPGGTLGHHLVYLVTRNLLWLLRRQREWVAFVLFGGETVLRAVANLVLRPRASWEKSRMRFRGLRAGLFAYPFAEEKGDDGR